MKMSDPKDNAVVPNSDKDAVKIEKDGKIVIVDPSLLDAVSGGASDPGDDVDPDSISIHNGGCGAGC